MTQLALFDGYPSSPGWKGAGGTSKAAAAAIAPRAQLLRDRVLALFVSGRRLTADECAEQLGLSILSIRPRIAELSAKGLIEDSGARGRTASGSSCISWVRR